MLTRISRANSLCDSPICSRTALASGARTSKRRDAAALPFEMALASCTIQETLEIARDMTKKLIEAQSGPSTTPLPPACEVFDYPLIVAT